MRPYNDLDQDCWL